MRILRLSVILFLLLCGFSSAREVKFVHITDINLSYNEAQMNTLYRTIKEINNYPDIDFVVFGGNNIAKSNIQNLDSFLYLLKKVKKPAYVLLGSSDVSASNGISKDYYLRRVWLSRHFRHSLKTNYVFKKKDNIFIVMDGSKQYFQSSNGYYKKAELDWLEDTLQKYEGKNVIILQHFPVLEEKKKWLLTKNADEYQEIISKHKNVKMIVSGHYGDNIEAKKDDIRHIITESYSKNHSYKIIQVDFDEDFIGTYLVK